MSDVGSFFRIHFFKERKTGRERCTWSVYVNGQVVCRSSRSYRSQLDLLKHLRRVYHLVRVKLDNGPTNA